MTTLTQKDLEKGLTKRDKQTIFFQEEKTQPGQNQKDLGAPYKFYRDPGHGWLAVSRQELIDLHIDKQISKFSYQQHNQIYLEEDSDMPLFLRAKGQANTQIIDTIRRYPEQDSIIRSYEPYDPNYQPTQKPFTVQTAEKTDPDIRILRKSNYGRQPIPEICTNLYAILNSKCINQPAPRQASLWNAIDILEDIDEKERNLK